LGDDIFLKFVTIKKEKDINVSAGIRYHRGEKLFLPYKRNWYDQIIDKLKKSNCKITDDGIFPAPNAYTPF
jgi:hypothetical protein